MNYQGRVTIVKLGAPQPGSKKKSEEVTENIKKIGARSRCAAQRLPNNQRSTDTAAGPHQSATTEDRPICGGGYRLPR
jgi:hypothetical protein